MNDKGAAVAERRDWVLIRAEVMVVGENETIKTFGDGRRHQLDRADLAARRMLSGMGVQFK